MGERSFKYQLEARAFAKEIAISTKTLTKVHYKDGLWVVEGKNVLSEKNVVLVISKIRGKLDSTESIDELVRYLDNNDIKIAVKNICDINSLSACDRDIYEKIPIFLTELKNASDAIEDMEDVKSKEHATELAHTFHELAIIFSDYPISSCLRRHKQSMLNKSKQLKSEVVSNTDANLCKSISRLESNAGRCKCGNGRRVIQKGKFGYLWGCSNFPVCFFKRALTTAENNDLEGWDYPRENL